MWGDTEQVGSRLLCSQVGGAGDPEGGWSAVIQSPWGPGAPSRGFGGRGQASEEGSGPGREEQVSSAGAGPVNWLRAVMPVDNLGRISPIRWCRERGLRQAGLAVWPGGRSRHSPEPQSLPW